MFEVLIPPEKDERWLRNAAMAMWAMYLLVHLVTSSNETFREAMAWWAFVIVETALLLLFLEAIR